MIVEKTPYSAVIEGRPDSPKRTLAEFARYLATAKAVVSNDTMALHLAAALDIPAIGITNGTSGKDDFWPYPPVLEKRIEVITPNVTHHMHIAGPLGLAINQLLDYRAITSITPERVFKKLESVL